MVGNIKIICMITKLYNFFKKKIIFWKIVNQVINQLFNKIVNKVINQLFN